MKIKNLICIASILIASLSGAIAANTLSSWTFDNLSIGANNNPAPSAGLGSAAAVGLGNTVSPSIVLQAGSSSGAADSWQFSATGGSDGWTTNAAIGKQGAKFAVSTVGFYQIQISFDVYATANAEANLQVQYTTDGSIWNNAAIASVGSGATLKNNSITTNSLVVGSYVNLSSGWNNQIKVDLSGVSGVDNDPNFAIRIVNASTGTNCLDTTGAHYDNSNATANWTFDNVMIQGVSYDTIAYWPFDNDSSLKKPVNNPPAAITNNNANASIIGFNLPSYVFGDGSVGSTNYADITSTTPASSTPNALYAWRLRGQKPGNGWNSDAAIGTQGAELNVSTVNYSNVVVTFDCYFTSQGEAKMCVLYTTDGWATTNVADQLAYGANPTFIETNSASPNTVQGTYFFNNVGSLFYNDLVVDFTGVSAVNNNPNFGVRIVNASKGSDCVNYLLQPYNNASGNWRLDNVAVNGQFVGTIAPAITNSPSATVDAPFTNTFAVSPAWTNAIKSIYVNGSLLPQGAYTITSSNIVFDPSKSALLQVSGLDYIVIYATGYTSAKVTQPVATGVARQLVVTQVASPSASGGTLTLNPTVGITDQYGNGTTNPYGNFDVFVTVSNSASAGWTLGGATNQQIVDGFCVFTDLTATVTGTLPVNGAAIQFNVVGYTNAATLGTTTNFYSTTFDIGAPPVPFTPGNLAVLQMDTLSNNTTFSIIELSPSTIGQTNAINIVPISATGTNALRMSPSGSCGHLALSDDGTFLVFDAFQDGSSATPDETFNLNRAVGTLNYTNKFTSPVSYESTSFGGSQARAACSPDNNNFVIDDKGGLYVNNFLNYQQNNISVRSFGGATWVLTAKVAFPPTPSLYQFANAGSGGSDVDFGDPSDNGPVIHDTFTPPSDPVAQDFYMIATNGTYGVAYILDQNAGTNGSSVVINKWLLSGDGYTWIAAGSWTNDDNGDTLFATTNGSGGVYLYYANGSGGQGGNQLIRLTDDTVAGPLNITSDYVIYTAPADKSIAGVTFVPLQTPYATQLIPPPGLIAATGVTTNSSFNVVLNPEDSNWRSGITSVTVDGTILPPAAYDATRSGLIVFDPAQSGLLQSAGSKTIVINAIGYSADSVVQTINPVYSTTLGGISLNDGGMKFTFTNTPGLSFSVLSTNNITAPVSTWPVIGTAIEGPAGIYNFTNSVTATNSQQFYILRQP
ncbi:MAG TPA: hemoblobin-interacting domain-containing protein [Verrucomicrobiae bacterium]|nr:hemoblobin-interacting domain-containing protein [Verrucomicrobiae bacterium]